MVKIDTNKKGLAWAWQYWGFRILVILIALLGVWLTIREINYDKWYPEDVKTTETENVENIILMDSTQLVNLNLEEILMNCPVDTEFYSVSFGTVKFVEVVCDLVKVKTDKDAVIDYNFKGHCLLVGDSTCTLFPSKMNHSWYNFDKSW